MWGREQWRQVRWRAAGSDPRVGPPVDGGLKVRPSYVRESHPAGSTARPGLRVASLLSMVVAKITNRPRAKPTRAGERCAGALEQTDPGRGEGMTAGPAAREVAAGGVITRSGGTSHSRSDTPWRGSATAALRSHRVVAPEKYSHGVNGTAGQCTGQSEWHAGAQEVTNEDINVMETEETPMRLAHDTRGTRHHETHRFGADGKTRPTAAASFLTERRSANAGADVFRGSSASEVTPP